MLKLLRDTNIQGEKYTSDLVIPVHKAARCECMDSCAWEHSGSVFRRYSC